MAIYRCNACGTITELADAAHGSKTTCSACQAPVSVYDTRFFVKGLVDRFLVMRRELDALKAEESDSAQPDEQAPSAAPTDSLPTEDFRNTAALATEAQHQPIVQWLASRQIRAQCDYAQVDTTGFFDEAADLIVSHHALLLPIVEQMRYAYRREWTWLNVDVAQRSEDERKQLNQLLRQLYSYSLFSRHHFNRQKQSIGIGLQSATAVRRFFEGGWLEWWALISLLNLCRERKVDFSCARSLRLEYAPDEKRELDVVFLINRRFPVVVECKTGEFRPDIDRCVALRKRLSLDSSQYVMCVTDLDQSEARSLSAMYGLTFTNPGNFVAHCSALLA